MLAILATVLLVSYSSKIMLSGPNITFSGHVTEVFQGEISTEPIANALVRLYSSDQILETRTLSDGHFTFVDVSPGKYSLEADAAGYLRTTMRGIRVVEESASQPIKVGLGVANPTCSSGSNAVYGPVHEFTTEQPLSRLVRNDQSSLGLAGAELELRIKGSAAAAPRRSVTNRSGKFSFKLMRPGEYEIIARCKGFNEEHLTDVLVSRENKTSLNIVMIPEGVMMVCQ